MRQARSMNPLVDIVLAIVGVISLLTGLSRGAIRTLGSTLGVVGGLAAGFSLSPIITQFFASKMGSSTPLDRGIAMAAVILTIAIVIAVTVTILTHLIAKRVGRGWGRGIDRAVGGALGAVTWAALTWAIAGLTIAIGISPLAGWAAQSVIVQNLNRISPITSTTALGAIDDSLAGVGLPRVFEGAESIRPIDAPTTGQSLGVQQAGASVVKILTTQTSCNSGSEGSGWVLSHGIIVTNAHVVAGSDLVVVQARNGQQLPARVIRFDPERDVAALSAPQLASPALATDRTATTGDSGFALGYPNDGGYTVSAARIRQQLTAHGSDIYKKNEVAREIFSLRGQIRPGNSGGPLVNGNGKVIGMVFARSLTDNDTGYALTLNEIQPVLNGTNTQPVSTGACTAA